MMEESYFEQFRGDEPETITFHFFRLEDDELIPTGDIIIVANNPPMPIKCAHEWIYVGDRRMCYKCGLREK